MKTCVRIATLLLALAVLALSCCRVDAQTTNSGVWTNVTSWGVQYTLTGTGSGMDSVGTGFSWTVNKQVTVNGILTGAQAAGSQFGWAAFLPNASGSVSDNGTQPCVPGPGNSTWNEVGNSVITAEISIVLDMAKGTYYVYFAGDVSATETLNNCGNTSTSTFPWALGPMNNQNPPTFPLPSQVGVLQQTNFTFSAPTVNPIGVPANWTLSFTLTPKVDDDARCKQNGEQGEPVSSSVSCQNQSLGEDVPIVGTGFNLHYESERTPGAGGNSVASAYASMLGGWTLSAHHAYDPITNTLFLGDGGQRNAYQLGAPLIFNGNFLLTSEDGSEVYVFSASGQHLQTVRPLTGTLLYQFGYDAAGNLVTVTDANGNVTTIQRDAVEHPTAIVSPYGQTTTLSVDPNGFLSQVTDPFGKSAAFTNSSTGLLASRTDENGNLFNYTYDAQGRLSKDADSLGGFTALTRTKAASGLGWTVGETTSMGRTSSYQTTPSVPWFQTSTSTFSNQQMNVLPNGLQATSTKTQQGSQISESSTLPDGKSYSDTLGPDPVWGLQVPVATSETLTKGNLTMNISRSRTASLGTPGNPFSLLSQTDTRTINGRTDTSAFTASNRTIVDSTPMDRKLSTVLDNQERISRIQIEGLLASNFGYDLRGRLLAVTQGTRKSTFTYDSNGRLATATDPLGLKKSFSYDADGRLLSPTLADGRIINYQYDANGNLTTVIPPGKSAHSFTYTAVNQISGYQPPSVAGTGSTTYSYNADRDLTQITRPDLQTISYGYDNAGRLSSVTTPSETTNYTYDSTTGNLTVASISGGEALSYGYNGPLPTSSSWTGTVNGGVSLAYNNNFWVTSENINGGNTIVFSYDNDGLVTNAGALTLNRSPLNGLITGTTLGLAGDSRTYNSFGELTGYTASYNGVGLYSVSYTRDADGRVSRKTETIGGLTNTYAYSYDLAGRLVGVSQNGVPVSSYSYDSNSNRIGATTTFGAVRTTQGSYTRYAGGRIGSESEIIGVHANTYAYPDDLDDRLGGLSQNAAVPRYSHEANFTRPNAAPLAGTVSATYDAQDRLLSYGPAAYTYTANGELASQTVGAQTTSYQYDVLGNLVSVTLPNSTAISYVVDAGNRRVGKKVNGALVEGFLYDGNRIVAQLNGSNALVSQFIYASSATSPNYMVSGGVTYRIFSDQLGSPRLVVNTSTGAIAQQITYDEFGNVLSDSNPGFQPFGFGGGLYDQDAKLVRFGARDYDPKTGRWTAKDPLLFNGRDTNLYGYVLNDPVNRLDPTGRGGLGTWVGALGEAGIGFGGSIQGTVGGGFFQGGGKCKDDVEYGSWVSGGGFIGADDQGAAFVSGPGNQVYGVGAGIGAGAYYTTATSVEELTGPSDVLNVSVGFVSFQYSTSGSVQTFSLGLAKSIGVSISHYRTTTKKLESQPCVCGRTEASIRRLYSIP